MTSEEQAQFHPEPTGIPGLDELLGGGLPANNLIFFIGSAGAGKTVLSLQISCYHARHNRSVLFLTTFSESHDKLIAHMSQFSFFDQKLIGQEIILLSLLPLLQPNTDNAVRKIVRTVRQNKIKLLVIDGFRGIREFFEDERSLRHFLQTLSTQLAYLGITVLITWETDAEENQLQAELTISDSTLGLHHSRFGLDRRRMLEVRKVRGQQHKSGLHRYHITQHGIVLYPRLETAAIPDDTPLPINERASFKVPELDSLLNGGFNRGTSTLIAGSIGTGKTLLGLQFLIAGAQDDEPGLLVTLSETPSQLRAAAAGFGLDLDTPLKNDTIRILRRAPVELDVDELASALLAELDARPVKRLVIDGIRSLQKALDRDHRTEDYLSALVEVIRSRQITSLMVVEINRMTGSELDFAETPLAVLGENVLLLQQEERNNRWNRTLAVIHMRFSAHDRSIHEFTITERGLQVRALPQSDERTP